MAYGVIRSSRFYVLDRIHAHTLSQYLVALECLSCDRSFDYYSISIFIKVPFKPTPQHHGASNRERKLNCTLIWVTFSSMLFLVAILFPRYFWVFFQGRIIFFLFPVKVISHFDDVHVNGR